MEHHITYFCVLVWKVKMVNKTTKDCQARPIGIFIKSSLVVLRSLHGRGFGSCEKMLSVTVPHCCCNLPTNPVLVQLHSLQHYFHLNFWWFSFANCLLISVLNPFLIVTLSSISLQPCSYLRLLLSNKFSPSLISNSCIPLSDHYLLYQQLTLSYPIPSNHFIHKHIQCVDSITVLLFLDPLIYFPFFP